jgi:NAD(P)-dependent dehydrogenase (short-subunit alcohol dehydrogenase family)
MHVACCPVFLPLQTEGFGCTCVTPLTTRLLEQCLNVLLLSACFRAAQQLQARAGSAAGIAEAAELDLASMASIRGFAESFSARGLPLHCLVCNAGVFLPPYSKTEWGSEVRLLLRSLDLLQVSPCRRCLEAN